MVTGPAGASVDVLARKAFLNPACQNEVGLVAVVPGVLRLEPRRPSPDGRLSDHLAVSELIPRQINFHASRKPIPHVRFRSLAVAEDVRRQDFSAKDVVQDQRCNVALPARGIARRPSIVLFRRIETPAGSDGAFDLSERVHRTRVLTSGTFVNAGPRGCRLLAAVSRRIVPMKDDGIPVKVATSGKVAGARVPRLTDELNTAGFQFAPSRSHIGHPYRKPSRVGDERETFSLRLPEAQRDVWRLHLADRYIALRQTEHVAVPAKSNRGVPGRNRDEVHLLNAHGGEATTGA